MTRLKPLAVLPLVATLAGCAAGIIAGTAVTGIFAAHDRRTAGTVLDDQVLEVDLSSTLGVDEELREFANINATVYNRTILLTGEAPTEDLKAKAEDIVARVTGDNNRVFNEIVVRAPSSLLDRSQDALVTTKVKTALLDVVMEGFDTTRIKVVTEAGVVYLMGIVTREEAEAVTTKAQTVGGVGKIVRLFEYIAPDDGRVGGKPKPANP